MTPDPRCELNQVYDPTTVARLDQWAPASVAVPPAAWRRHSAAGAVLAGLALGLQEVFEPRERDEVVEEVDVSGLLDPAAPVVYHHVAGCPPASVAIVRPWLFPVG